MKIVANKLQERFWIDMQLVLDNAYNIGSVFKIDGDFRGDLFAKAFTYVISQIDSLRSVFQKEKKFIYLVPQEPLNICFIQKKVDSYEKAEIELHKFESHVFDLSKEIPIRGILLHLPDNCFLLYLMAHHICSDGISNIELTRMFAECYNALLRNEPFPVLQIPSLADYNSYYESQENKAKNNGAMEYWKEFFNDKLLFTDLSYFQVSKKSKDGLCQFYFEEELQERLLSVAKELVTTPFIILLSAWLFTLARYTNNKKAITNYCVNIRPPKFRNLVSVFVNNLPAAIELNETDTFAQIILSLTQQRKEQKKYQNIILHDIVSELRKNGKIQPEMPFLNTAIDFTGWNSSLLIPLEGVEVSLYRRENVDFRFDLLLVIDSDFKYPSHIRYKNYLSDVFVEQFKKTFISFLKQALWHLDTPVLSFLFEDQVGVINEADQSMKEIEKLEHPLAVWKDVVALYSTKEALVIHEDRLTYGDLDTQSTLLSLKMKQYCLSQGIPLKNKSLRIGVCLNRNDNYIMAILAILKMGATYVPLDENIPSERISFIIEDAQLTFMLISHSLRKNQSKIPYLCLDDFEKIQLVDDVQLFNDYSFEKEAYIIYTSGTTGVPKGVPISFLALANFVSNARNSLHMTSETKQTQLTSICFDASIWEIFPTILTGATLYIVPDEVRLDPDLLASFITDFEVNSVFISPALLVRMKKQLPSVKVLSVGGESTPGPVVNKWSKNRIFINVYGPTESTVYSSCSVLTEGICSNDIGTPISGVSYYILDDRLYLLPDGVPGTLYIGGLQLTNGYIKRDELNAEKFVMNPYVSVDDERRGINTLLYNTGDIVCRISNGHYAFIGRNDSQVKIRGFRVELGEIENRICLYPGVNQVAVIVKKTDSINSLIAYIESQSLTESDIEGLRTFMISQLPDYMCPSVYVFLKSFPVTINGKIDRKSLPQSIKQKVKSSINTFSLLELLCCRKAEELLDIQGINPDDDLFHWGMNSLIVISLVIELEKLEVYTSIASIYKYRTIRLILSKASIDSSAFFWFNQYEPQKKVIVLFTDLIGVDTSLLKVATDFSVKYSVLIVDPYALYKGNQVPSSWNTFLADCMKMLSEVLLPDMSVGIFVGHSFGGEIAYMLAEEWHRKTGKLPNVWLYDSMAKHVKEEIDLIQVEVEQKQLPEMILNRINLLKNLILCKPEIRYQGKVLLLVATKVASSILFKDGKTTVSSVSINDLYLSNIDNWKRLVKYLFVYKVDSDHWSIMSFPILSVIS